MKKKFFSLMIIVIAIIFCTNFQKIEAQVIDAGAALETLESLNPQKIQMFKDQLETEKIKSDTGFVESQSKVLPENLNSYSYRLDPLNVKEIFPEIVYKQGEEYYIDYYSLFPILFNLISEQQKQISELKTQLEEIKTLK